MKNLINSIINQAANLGLSNQNIIDAKELVEYNERGIALELIITQIYEYEIKINKLFYKDIERLAKKFKMEEEHYSFLVELIDYRLNLK
ncbi:MafI family immunity protein [Bernardetia sp. ABR2-2B]|uniref:MafI family immunity protein n=1 Tax=Bernardetia sp. ABR2-2B TaxID=3127472 RepID=UPI0030CFDBC7